MVVYIIGKVYKYRKRKYLLILTILAGGTGVVAAEDGDLRLFAYPNPFVAGYADAQLAYYLPADAVVSINVYDLDGNHVRTLAERVDRPKGVYRGRERWDGRDDDGELVRAGPYLVVLDVRMGGEPYRDTFVAIVDR
ncbi:MAG TPA: FlgD immunoglobulin-like domain containing protein [bacterium]|nr:FlgD immunoglobulin-like domain containing protein [bacterium]